MKKIFIVICLLLIASTAISYNISGLYKASLQNFNTDNVTQENNIADVRILKTEWYVVCYYNDVEYPCEGDTYSFMTDNESNIFMNFVQPLRGTIVSDGVIYLSTNGFSVLLLKIDDNITYMVK